MNATLSDGGGYESFQQCMGNASCVQSALGGTGSAATDAGLLKKGLTKELLKSAAALPMDDIMKGIENGGSADQAIRAALGGNAGSMGSFGAALGNVAKTAQNDPSLSGGESSTSASTASLGGGGALGGQQQKASGGDDPFKLFGQGEANLGAAGGVAFEKQPEPAGVEIGQDGDIFHSSFSGSIFEIVSHKLNRTRDRVDNVGYSLPMNRALAGQR
jgi:hypothetical protein